MQKLEISKDSQLSLATAENQWLRERALALIEITSQQETQIKFLKEQIDDLQKEPETTESE